MIFGMASPAIAYIDTDSASTPVNRLQDGNFTVPMNAVASPWTVQLFAPASLGAMEVLTTGADAPSQRVAINNSGTANWHLMFQQMYTFRADVEYEFYFTARASIARPMDWQLSNPWQTSRINLTTEWQTFGPFTIAPQAANTERQFNLIFGGFPDLPAHDVFLREAVLVAVNEPGEPGPNLCDECQLEDCVCVFELCEDCRAYTCICDSLHEGRVGDIRMIRTPVAGEFPSSAFLNPSRDNGQGNANANGFHTTFTWYPALEHYFLPDTVYTVTVLLEPNDRWGQASGTATSSLLPVPGVNNAANRTLARIAGFHGNGITPANFGLGSSANFGDGGQPRFESLWDLPGVTDIDWEFGQSPATVGSNVMYGNLSIHITFEATGSEMEEASLVFSDDFSGEFNNFPQGLTTGFARSPQWSNRQGMDSWRNSQSDIVERAYGTGGNVLRLGFQHNPYLADQFAWSLPPSEFIRNNWIESGSVRTRGQTGGETANLYFEHAFGHYEARVKFPAANATWGAFWLMYAQGSVQRGVRSARIGSEIDQIETAANPFRNFNAASHWNGYVYDHANPTNHLFGPNAATRNRNINWIPSDDYLAEIGDIYDGEWHLFAVQWTPTDYIFLINDIEWARFSRHETFNWGGSTDPNVEEGWGWGGLIGPHMLNDPRHFAGIAENPNYMKLSVEAADWSGLGTTGPGLAKPCPFGSCDDCIYVSERNDVTNGLGWHRVESGEMIVDWVRVWNGPKPESAMERPAQVFTGSNPNRLADALAEGDVILSTPNNLGIFEQHSPFVIPAGRTLTVTTTLNIQRGATLIVEGRLLVEEGGRINNQGSGTGGGTIVVTPIGRLINHGYVENVTNSTVRNYGNIVNHGRFEVRAGTNWLTHVDGLAAGPVPFNINRNANVTQLN